MPIRVTQHMMYYDMVSRMQKSLSNYMESTVQGSSQKRINRPSDDPVGTYRVLTTRNDIDATKQYQENADTALGWLQLSDSVLSTQVDNAIIRLKTLAEQASTGTISRENRTQIGYEVSAILGQLLNLSNTRFEDHTIYSGHKYTESAFEMGLAITSWSDERQDPPSNWTTFDGKTPPEYVIEGASDKAIMVQFTGVDRNNTGYMNHDIGTTGWIGVDAMTYRWSNDGGRTWTDETLAPGSNMIVANGVQVIMPLDSITGLGQMTTVADITIDSGDPRDGTAFYIRPTAIYQGDDNDPPPKTTVMGQTATALGAITTSGTFHRDVLVRVDGRTPILPIPTPPAPDLDVDYSYSIDGGSTWVQAKTQTTTIPPSPVRFTVPGGFMDVQNLPADGTQILIHPDRADLPYEIMRDTFVDVNGVGKDIFGGYYQNRPALNNNGDLSANLFEVVGNFVAYCEYNNQEGCQRTLAALTVAQNQILTQAARVGGQENRVQMAQDVLSFQLIDQSEQLSYVEDIDLTELLTKLTQQQLIYSTVLKSSSMIMQLSLANYV